VRLENCHSSGQNAVVGHFTKLCQRFIRKEKMNYVQGSSVIMMEG